MGLPATTLSIPFDAHAMSVGVYQDLIPSVDLSLGFSIKAKAARVDSVALVANVEGAFTPRALARRLDDCLLPPVVLSLGFQPRLLAVAAPFPPTALVAGLNIGGEPLLEPEGMFDKAIPMTFSGALTAQPSYNNPNLNCTDLARQVYYMWGYQTRDIKSIGIGLDSIAMWANTAMQLIFSQADKLDFFNREPLTLTVTATGKVALPSGLQRIQGPVTVTATGKTLRPLSSRGEMNQFITRFMGDASTPPAYPLAYWCEATRSAGADSVAAALHLVPAPQADVEISLDVTLEPPRYSEADLLFGRIIEIPQKWAETLLIPLVKKWALGDPIMPASSREAMQPQIDQQYAAALRTLELADPSAPAVTQSKPVEAADSAK